MFPLLYKYLMLHSEVCIPGVGRFYKVRNAAQHDFVNRMFIPPAYTIRFKEEQVRADKHLFSFISREKGIDEVEAIRHYHDFSYQFSDHVKRFSQTHLPGVGVLKKGNDGSLSFTADEMFAGYFVATPAERILRRDITHPLVVGDKETTTCEMQVRLDDVDEEKTKSRWWIWALLLGIAAAAAIAFYYLQHGNVRL